MITTPSPKFKDGETVFYENKKAKVCFKVEHSRDLYGIKGRTFEIIVYGRELTRSPYVHPFTLSEKLLRDVTHKELKKALRGIACRFLLQAFKDDRTDGKGATRRITKEFTQWVEEVTSK